MHEADEPSEEISAAAGENAVVIFRSAVLRSWKMIVSAPAQTS